jgi:exosortase family protein XrtF
MSFIKENKKAIRFLLIFIGVYLVLNSLYGFFIHLYWPTSDPITRSVAKQLVWVISIFDHTVACYHSDFNEYIAIANDRENLIDLFEGCNGINVMIVYLSFIIAFRSTGKRLLGFALLGILAIHALNLARISMLYGVAIYFPGRYYFFHKYFFTGIIYIIVFALWYFWVRGVKAYEQSTSQAID